MTREEINVKIMQWIESLIPIVELGSDDVFPNGRKSMLGMSIHRNRSGEYSVSIMSDESPEDDTRYIDSYKATSGNYRIADEYWPRERFEKTIKEMEHEQVSQSDQ